jgi:hypothetical protein
MCGRKIMKYLPLVISLVFIGCGTSDDSSDTSAADEVPEAEGSISEALHEPLDKAEAVEDVIMKAKEDRDKALEAAEDASD